MKTKIILATGIFYPDIGGPAIHVEKIAECLTAEGFAVAVIAYGENFDREKLPFQVFRISRHQPKIFQWLGYLSRLLKEIPDSTLVYSFDLTAAGIPAALVSLVFRKPMLLRAGGDPIWERVVEINRRFMTIEDYYQRRYYRRDNPVLYWLIRLVLKKARVLVTYNQFFKDFYQTYFGVPSDKVRIVKNPVFKRETASIILPSNPIVLFGGRFVSYKNLGLVIRAFDTVRQKLGTGRLWLIGDGPEKNNLLALKQKAVSSPHITFYPKVSQEELFGYIRQSACSIAPAINEFNPNFILESLSLGKPVLISRGNGLSIKLPEQFLFDPFNQHELEDKLLSLFNPQNYSQAVATISQLPMDQTWEKVTDFHLALVGEIIAKPS